jgi:hypothetical protein
MRFFLSFLLIILMSFAACLYFPWWSIAIVSFIVATLIPQPPGRSFITGVAAIYFLWTALAFYISFQNDHVFAHRISVLILKMDNVLLLVIVTATIGSLVAGFGALSGSYFRKLFR